MIDDWEGCKLKDCPYDKEYADCEWCENLIKKEQPSTFTREAVIEILKDCTSEIYRKLTTSVADDLYYRALGECTGIIEKKIDDLKDDKPESPLGSWIYVKPQVIKCSKCGKRVPDERTYIPMYYCPICGDHKNEFSRGEVKNET